MSKRKFACAVYMGEHGIDVYCNNDAIAPLLDGDFVPYIPEYRREARPCNSGFRMEVDIGLPLSITPSEDLHTWFVCGEAEELCAGNTIPYLIHYILEMQRMGQCQVTLHGAAVEKNGQGMLLLGKQGSGKTSLCLELCRNYGYSIVGNDLVLVGLGEGGAFLYGGTKVFRLRRATIAYHNMDLEHLFGEKSNRDDWTSVAAVTPDALGVTVALKPVPICKVAHVHLLNDVNAQLHTNRVEKMFSRLFLHEETSRYIRGVCFPMFVGQTLEYGPYVPSLDCADFHENRRKLISWIESHSSYGYVSGPIDKLCAYLTGGGKV